MSKRHYPSLHMTTNHSPLHSITTHHCPSLPITIHHYTWSLSITTHHHTSIAITVHHYLSLPTTTHHCPSLHITVHRYPSLHMTTPHDYTSLCLVCKRNCIEDEKHFLIDCTEYESLRQQLYFQLKFVFVFLALKCLKIQTFRDYCPFISVVRAGLHNTRDRRRADSLRADDN